jgi:hypothetical protein
MSLNHPVGKWKAICTAVWTDVQPLQFVRMYHQKQQIGLRLIQIEEQQPSLRPSVRPPASFGHFRRAVRSSIIFTTSQRLCIIELNDAEVGEREQRFAMHLVKCTK